MNERSEGAGVWRPLRDWFDASNRHSRAVTLIKAGRVPGFNLTVTAKTNEGGTPEISGTVRSLFRPVARFSGTPKRVSVDPPGLELRLEGARVAGRFPNRLHPQEGPVTSQHKVVGIKHALPTLSKNLSPRLNAWVRPPALVVNYLDVADDTDLVGVPVSFGGVTYMNTEALNALAEELAGDTP